MITMKSWRKSSILYSIFFLTLQSECHVQMSYPFPLRSKYNPLNSYNDIDYSMSSPLNADGSDFPCKGYQNDRPIQPVVTYAAGATYNMTLAGSAMHGGGSCQLSLSYDNGATFQVIQSMIGGCPLTFAYNFTIPSDAPIGTALFAWTWQNAIGNREFYMNCAEVDIVSGYTERRRRDVSVNFGQLPDIWKGNLKGLNNCVTVENETVIYPQPGPNVIYAEDFSRSSPPTPGDCNAAVPYGRTYRNLTAATSISSSVPSSLLQTIPESTSNTYVLAPSPSSVTRQSMLSSESYSTTTVTVDCQETLILTAMPSYYIAAAPSAACTGTSAFCPCAANYQCQELSPCLWGCAAQATGIARISIPELSVHTSSRSIRYLTDTLTVIPTKPSQSTQPTAGAPSSHPPYAGLNVNRYLPCVPGSFICIDDTTWDTCDYNAAGRWAYEDPRKVADGMECITFLSPYSSATSQHGQQGSTPQGYYRDDRVVRARPDGDCNQNGAIKCTQGGQMFEICDQGGWVNMGSVAAGTLCENGSIV